MLRSQSLMHIQQNTLRSGEKSATKLESSRSTFMLQPAPHVDLVTTRMDPVTMEARLFKKLERKYRALELEVRKLRRASTHLLALREELEAKPLAYVLPATRDRLHHTHTKACEVAEALQEAEKRKAKVLLVIQELEQRIEDRKWGQLGKHAQKQAEGRSLHAQKLLLPPPKIAFVAPASPAPPVPQVEAAGYTAAVESVVDGCDSAAVDQGESVSTTRKASLRRNESDPTDHPTAGGESESESEESAGPSLSAKEGLEWFSLLSRQLSGDTITVDAEASDSESKSTRTPSPFQIPDHLSDRLRQQTAFKPSPIRKVVLPYRGDDSKRRALRVRMRCAGLKGIDGRIAIGTPATVAAGGDDGEQERPASPARERSVKARPSTGWSDTLFGQCFFVTSFIAFDVCSQLCYGFVCLFVCVRMCLAVCSSATSRQDSTAACRAQRTTSAAKEAEAAQTTGARGTGEGGGCRCGRLCILPFPCSSPRERRSTNARHTPCHLRFAW